MSDTIPSPTDHKPTNTINESRIEQSIRPIEPGEAGVSCQDCSRGDKPALQPWKNATHRIRCVTTDIFVCAGHATARKML